MTFGALLERHPVPKHITLVRPLQGWGVLVPVQSRLGRLHILLQGSQAGVHLQQAAQRLALLLQAPCVAGCRRPMAPDAAAQLIAGVTLSSSSELRQQGPPSCLQHPPAVRGCWPPQLPRGCALMPLLPG